MFDEIKSAFPQADTGSCLQTIFEREFYIHDHEIEKRCYVQDDSNGVQHFKVVSKTEKPVNFLAIDKCLFTDKVKIERCDCAVFNDQTFCFIEIKTTSSEKDRRIAKCRKKASDQLMNTILHFKDRMAFDGCQIEAYITLVTASSSLNSGTDELEEELLPRPRTRTNLVEMIAIFDEMGVALHYDNRKTFA